MQVLVALAVGACSSSAAAADGGTSLDCTYHFHHWAAALC